MANKDFYNSFKSVYKADEGKYINNWIVRWKYIDIVQNKQEFYQLERLYSYKGKSDLIEWFDYGMWHERMDYFPKQTTKSLMDLSRDNDKKIFNNLGLNFKWSDEAYNNFIGKNNSEDYQLQNFYPVPSRYQTKNILDFGAGFGRQANLWSQLGKDITYVGMDAIPNSYCTQNLYYSCLGVPFMDYVDDPDQFEISDSKKGIYHLPTWRYDLLPSKFFDLVICSQVLSEINGKLGKRMIQEFYRILKPGGALYVRDPGPYKHKVGNRINIDKYIIQNGFHLEFSPYIIHNVDLQSFPRIWRKNDEKVEQARRRKVSLIDQVNFYSKGLLKKYYRKLTGK